MNDEDFQNIAEKARELVKEKFKKSPLMKNKMWRERIDTLQGFCAQVSAEVIKLLDKEGIKSHTIPVVSGKSGGGNHIAVYVPSEDTIIDGTLNQYTGKYRYSYKKDNYPLKLQSDAMKEFVKEFEQMRYMAELRALSKYSLEHPLNDKQYNRMMELKEKMGL